MGMRTLYRVLAVEKDQITVISCDEKGEPQTIEGKETVLVFPNAERSLPYTNSDVGYEFIINTEGSVSTVCGCSSVSFEKKQSLKDMVADIVLSHTSGKIKTKLEELMKKIGEVRVNSPQAASECHRAVARLFAATHPDLPDIVEEKVRSAQQIISKSSSVRAVENFCFCVGFHDKQALGRVLDEWAVDSVESWFAPVGYGKEEERIEHFWQLYASFRKRDAAFIEHLREMIRRDPTAFFDPQRRPVAMRCLGDIRRDFFETFCGEKITFPVSKKRSLVMERKVETDGLRVLRVGGQCVSEQAAGLCRTLVSLKKQGLLRVEKEMDVVLDTQSKSPMQDCKFSLKGQSNRLEEVHAMASTRRLCVRFDTLVNGTENADNLKNRFMRATTAVERNHVSLFVRDAHTLSHAELSHLLWRVASRGILRGLTLTTRFTYDPVFCGSVSGIIDSLTEMSESRRRECSYVFKVDGAVPSLDNDSLDTFSGVCIVPMARDAHGTDEDGDFRSGQQVFIVNPPLYGKVNKRVSSNRLSLFMPMETKETTVATHAKDGKNAWKCNHTKARGVVIPVSALNFQRKRMPFCNTPATVFVPKIFDAHAREELVHAAKSFFLRVKVFDVETYEVSARDSETERKFLEALEKSV